jgi:hypothetical protein
MIMSNYKSFEDWFDEMEGFGFRSERIHSDLQCAFADPFKRSQVIQKWLRIAWDMGYNTCESKHYGATQ